MESPALGVLVRDERGRTVGLVTAVNPCCVTVAAETARSGALHLIPDGFFNVTPEEAALICDLSECERYACLNHTD